MASNGEKSLAMMEETSRSASPGPKRRPPKRKAKNPAEPKLQGKVRRVRNSVLALRPHLVDANEVTSESEETTRIRSAEKGTRKWNPKADDAKSDATSTTSHLSDAGIVGGSSSKPKTNGLFDYTEWLVAKLGDEQREALKHAFEKTTYMDLCAGLGTSLIVNEALKRALLPCAGATCTGLTESSKEKQVALQRRLDKAGCSAVPVLASNAALGSRHMQDVKGKAIEVPKADILFMGIVCVDISRCSSTPKSLTDSEGASAASWSDFMSYLQRLTFEDLPKAIILECVENLGNERKIGGTHEKGTKLVVEALKEKGYVGKWVRISAIHFGLPQRRPRVWGLFLRTISGVGPKAVDSRTKDLTKALDFVQSAMYNGHDTVQDTLARVAKLTPTPAPTTSTKPRKPGAWKTKSHPKFIEKHGLTEADISMGKVEFYEKTSRVLGLREQEAVWLELCRLRKRGTLPNWQHDLFVSDCGSSVDWLSVTKDCFPCLRPGNKYLVLHKGVAKIANGLECLAVQGIGLNEIEAFGLSSEKESLLKSLAGNAFSANIAAAFFVASLLASSLSES